MANNRPAATQAQGGYRQYGDTSTLSWTNKAEGGAANTTTSGEEDASSSSCDSDTDHFHSVTEQNQSILECQMNPCGVVGGGASSSAQDSHVKVTGTEGPPDTADRYVNTAVYTSDLDYLMEVFKRLKSVEVEFRELKDKMTRSGELLKQQGTDSTLRCCGCAQRAQRAELTLLALQYGMCQQHCWRWYYNTATQRRCFHPGPEENYRPGSLPVPAELASVLKTLECDYNEMRRKILAGATLEQLKPLSVSYKYTLGTESCYVPAQDIIQLHTSCPSDKDEHKNEEAPRKTLSRGEFQVMNTSAAWYNAEEDLDPSTESKGVSSQTTKEKEEGELQVMNTSAAWYDAEEDLDPSAESKGVLSQTTKEKKDGQEKEKGLFLQISNLPCPAVMETIPRQQSLRSSTAAVVCDTVPAALCTSAEPQWRRHHQHHHHHHGGTMGSFDTLVSRLLQRHPGAGSQAVVGALKQLRLQQRGGALRGLPLRDIENMASELLSARDTANPL